MKTKELLNSISNKNYSEAKSLLNSILDDKKAQAIKSKLKESKQIVERKFDIDKTENIKERGITKTIGDYISYARDSIEYISSPKGSEDLYAIIKDAGRYILYGVEPKGKDYKIKSFVGGFNNISRAQDYIKEIKESNQSIKEKLSNKKT